MKAKFYTASEIGYAEAGRLPEKRYAGMFAAKEAVFKALNLNWTGPFTWKWIEIDHAPDGSPRVKLHADLDAVHQSHDARSTTVSISYAGSYAVAVALAELRDCYAQDRTP